MWVDRSKRPDALAGLKNRDIDASGSAGADIFGTWNMRRSQAASSTAGLQNEIIP
jgi:hypothetical protein